MDKRFDYDALRKAWEHYLLGDPQPDTPEMRTVIASLDRIAALNTGYVPEDAIESPTAALPQYTLRALAMAYRVPGTAHYQKAETHDYVLSELERIYETDYNCGHEMDNFWTLEIGVPLRLLDILVLLYDEIPDREARIQKYTDVILHFKDSYKVSSRGMTETGANLIWKCSILMLTGILRQEGEWIDFARENIISVLQYKETLAKPGMGKIWDDGFHRDGSFVQHFFFGYTGGYGKHLINILSGMLYAYHDTGALDIPQENLDFLYHMVFDAYEPLIVNGHFMDLARGREPSRYFYQDSVCGRHVMRALCYLAATMPSTEKIRTHRMLKQWLLYGNNLQSFLVDEDGHAEYYVQPSILPLLAEIMRPEVQPRGDLLLHKNYGVMAKSVHHAHKYAAGISMYSPNIAKYERLNTESEKFWHMSDGVTYIYTADSDQYDHDYYATVDMQRLPGTTVDRSTTRAADGYFSWYMPDTKNPYAFAGGSELNGRYGAVGFRYCGQGKGKTHDLEVKKSWFLFDDEIVCLGSGITSPSGDAIETIIDNKRLLSGGTNEIRVNGIPVSHSACYWGVKTLHLQGNCGTGSDMGYYFPQPAAVNVLREHRQGTWNSLTLDPRYVKENNFATFWLAHGTNPTDADYAYVILPAADGDATQRYAADPAVEILENTPAAHAVHHKGLGITAVNFFAEDTYTAAGIRCSGQASVMVRVQRDVMDIAVTDPTNGDAVLTVSFSAAAQKLLERDDGIELLVGEPLTAKFDTTGFNGQSLHLRVRFTPMEPLTNPKKEDHMQDDYYKVTPDFPNHYRIFSAEGVHSDLFVGETSALLWDTGYGFGKLRTLVDRLAGGKPITVVNSHGHLDHVNGNPQFADCPIYVSKADLQLYHDHSMPEFRAQAVADAKATVVDYTTQRTENILPVDFDEDAYKAATMPEPQILQDGQVFDLGGIILRVIAMPGHTPGCMGLVWEAERVLFSGDNLSTTVWLHMPESSTLPEYIALLKKVRDLPIDYYHTAHRPERFDRKQLEALIETAETLDYDKAYPVPKLPHMLPGQEVRVWSRPGYTPMDREKPGFASIFIAKEKL